MILLPEDLLKLLLAVLVGGLIGLEREFRDKAAGFRTIIFICVGATLFTILSFKLGGDEDPVRIAANIVSGVGFLGAGVILRGNGRIIGLTTASTIWIAAALGMGIGGGQYLVVGAATVVVLIVLWVFRRIETRIESARDPRTYEVVIPNDRKTSKELEDLALESGLKITAQSRSKSGEEMILSLNVTGSTEQHERFSDKLLAHAEVKQFKI
jgi:putative Mg2+ transporter-C (MgtC) family protein